MPSLALQYDAETGVADLIVRNGTLVLDDGLETLVLISLLTDAAIGIFDPPFLP